MLMSVKKKYPKLQRINLNNKNLQINKYIS